MTRDLWWLPGTVLLSAAVLGYPENWLPVGQPWYRSLMFLDRIAAITGIAILFFALVWRAEPAMTGSDQGARQVLRVKGWGARGATDKLVFVLLVVAAAAGTTFATIALVGGFADGMGAGDWTSFVLGCAVFIASMGIWAYLSVASLRRLSSARESNKGGR